MIDAFHTPPRTKANQQVFLPTGTNANSSWQHWNKPPGTTMVYMYATGGGGGGGGGFTRASGAAGGGGGGGAAATASLLIPAFFLPDVLYVQPGLGGLGSTGSGVAGTAGAHSYVSIGAYPSGTVASMITHQQILLHSGLLATPAGGGGAGTVAVGGPTGTAGAVATAPLNTLGSNVGFWKATAGGAGGIGGFGAGGTSMNTLVASINNTTGGAGGGGANAANTAGGNQAAGGYFRQVSGAAVGASGTAGSGITLWGRSIGGGGGDGSAAGLGGHGGTGGIGSGGGGGGSGTTGGRGGKGGDGLVVIISW